MRILFCDDNPEILDQLQKYVTEFFKGMGKLLPEMATYTSGDDLLQKETSLDKGTQRKTTENELPSLTQCTA